MLIIHFFLVLPSLLKHNRGTTSDLSGAAKQRLETEIATGNAGEFDTMSISQVLSEPAAGEERERERERERDLDLDLQ